MEEELFTRSIISPKKTGLKSNIYLIMFDGANSIWAPEPKAKVQLKDNEINILLEPNVRPTNIEQYNKLEPENKAIVDNAIKYIKANKDIFLRYWNGKFEEYDLHNLLKEEQ